MGGRRMAMRNLIIEGALREIIPVWYELDGKTYCIFSKYERPGARVVELPDGAKVVALDGICVS